VFYKNLILTLLFALNVAYGGNLIEKIDPSSCPTDRNLSAWCTEQLCSQQNDLQEELLRLLRVEKADWERKKKEEAPKFYEFCQNDIKENLSKKPLPQEIIKPTYELLSSKKIKKLLGIVTTDINPNDKKITALKNDGSMIKILCANDSIEADAATDHLHVFINPEALLSTHKTPEEIKATIAHELIHILYEDVLDSDCLNKLYKIQKKRFKIPRKKFSKLRAQWERGQEARADILSGLIDIKLAKAHEQHFFRNMPKKTKRMKASSLHPTNFQRHEYMKKIVQAMKTKKAHQKPNNYFLWTLLLTALLLFLFFITKKLWKKNL